MVTNALKCVGALVLGFAGSVPASAEIVLSTQGTVRDPFLQVEPFCTSTSEGPGPLAYSCADPGLRGHSVHANVDRGRFAAAASVDLGGAEVGQTIKSASVSTTFSDTLSFGVDRGIFRLPLEIRGELEVVGTVGTDALSRVSSLATAIFSVSFTSFNRFHDPIDFSAQRTVSRQMLRAVENGTVSVVTDDETFGDSLADTTLDVHFVDGLLALNTWLYTGVTCATTQPGSSCGASSDFSNTVRFLGASVLDENGELLPDVAISSESGFDYLTGVDAHAVPLPAALPMFLAALGILVGRRRRTMVLSREDLSTSRRARGVGGWQVRQLFGVPGVLLSIAKRAAGEWLQDNILPSIDIRTVLPSGVWAKSLRNARGGQKATRTTVAVVLACWAATAVSQTRYSVTEVLREPVSSFDYDGLALNSSGVVSGNLDRRIDGFTERLPFIWTKDSGRTEVDVPLTRFSDGESRANVRSTGIDDAGRLAAWRSGFAPNPLPRGGRRFTQQVVTWKIGDSRPSILALPSSVEGLPQSRAISGSGIVVGDVDLSDSAATALFRWRHGGAPEVIEVVPRSSVSAVRTMGVNRHGVVVGTYAIRAPDRSFSTRAFRWSRSGVFEFLPDGTAGGGESYAYDINDAGIIIGETEGGAVAWMPNGTRVPIEAPTGFSSTLSSDINSSGTVVGSARSGSVRAALVWAPNGDVRVIDSLVDWTPNLERVSIVSAFDINDDGVILARGANEAVYLLTPTTSGPDVLPPDFILGRVVTTNGAPVSGAVIKLVLRDDEFSSVSDDEGNFQLNYDRTGFPAFSVATVTAPGYNPAAFSVDTRQSEYRAGVVELSATSPRIVVIDIESQVRHLGDDLFEGTVNSQFQKISEGTIYRAAFNLTAAQATATEGSVRLFVKGSQCGNLIKVNGETVARLRNSSLSGDFDAQVLPARFGAPLAVGINTMLVESLRCSGARGGIDNDDFEFTALELELVLGSQQDPVTPVPPSPPLPPAPQEPTDPSLTVLVPILDLLLD